MNIYSQNLYLQTMDRQTFINTHKNNYESISQLVGIDLKLNNFDIFTHFDSLKTESDYVTFLNLIRSHGRFAYVIKSEEDKIRGYQIMKQAYFVGQVLGPYIMSQLTTKCDIPMVNLILSQIK